MTENTPFSGSSKRNFPHWIKAFVDYASFGEAPLSMYFWVGVSTVAGALRRCVWIEQGYFQWVPNFYVILVAPPGIVAKSTTASIGMNLLRRVPGIVFGPDVVTWQALAQALGRSTESIEMPDGLLHPMSAITIESSEFGTFLNPNDREMVDMLVSLWDGRKGAFRKLTKTQGEDVIENPWVNIIACTTPSWIEGNFPEYMVGGGFTSRCVFVYAEKKRQYVAYPSTVIPPEFLGMQQLLVEDLEKISMLRGAFTILPETIEWGEVWYRNHWESKPPHLDNERFGGYLSRKQTHIHKMAMILSAAQRDDLTICAADLDSANQIITTLEVDMPKVFEKIGTTESSRGGHELARVVEAYQFMEKSALFGILFRTMSYQDFGVALASAIMANKVVELTNGSKIYVMTPEVFRSKYGNAPTDSAPTTGSGSDSAATSYVPRQGTG